jgi:hypothetical protein
MRPDAGDHGGRPALVQIQGVITAREADTLSVETDRGAVSVFVRPHTRILLGRSGLTLEKVRAGETVAGHDVTVRGGFDQRENAVIADVIVLGPPASQ